MVAVVSDSAAAPDLPGAAESSVVLPEVQAHPVRKIAINFVRFASVLLGAGLLLRTGAAEQAVSASDAEKPQPQRPVGNRLVLPQPAFGHDLHAGKGSGLAEPSGGTAPHLAFAPEAGTPEAGTAEAGTRGAAARQSSSAKAHGIKAAPAAAANALASSAAVNAPTFVPGKARVDASVAPSSGGAASSAALASAAPKAFAAAKSAPARAGSAPQRTAALAAASSALILESTRRTASSGLLAPVNVVSRPVPTAAAAPALAATHRTPAIAGSAAPVVDGPGAAPPVKISLAPPVMRPGPRTTVLTSDIHDVMRRPASAWDYAEALPPELTGHASQQSASAQPQAIQQPAVQTAAVAPPKAAMQQAPAAQIAMHRAKPARIAPSQMVSGSVSERAVAAASSATPVRAGKTTRAGAAKTVPDRQAPDRESPDRQAVAVLSPSQIAQPVSESGRGVGRSTADRPVALLDLPPKAGRSAAATVPPARHLASAAHGRRSIPNHGRGSVEAKVALAMPRHKPHHSDMAATGGLAAPSDKAGSAAPSDHSANGVTVGHAAAFSAERVRRRYWSMRRLIAGEIVLSLRDRIPRPAF